MHPNQFEQTSHIAFDAAGNLYIADSENQRIRRIDAAGIIKTIAGSGEKPQTNTRCEPTRPAGDGAPALAARLSAGLLDGLRDRLQEHRRRDLRFVPRAVHAQYLRAGARDAVAGLAERRTLTGGKTAVGMQTLVDAIRATGASQVTAASAFRDPLGFHGFGAEAYLRDANVIYEVHPFFDQQATDDARDAAFGFLTGTFPVFAGAWGEPPGQSAACRAIPADTQQATDLLLRTLAYFDRAISPGPSAISRRAA